MTNSVYECICMQCFIEPLLVYAHIKIIIFKRFLHFLNQFISHKENNDVEVITTHFKDIHQVNQGSL